MFRFNFTLDDNDYLEFNKFYANTHPVSKKITRGVYILLLPFVLLLAIFLSFEDGQFLVSNFVIFAVVFAAVFGIMSLFDKKFTAWVVKAQLNAMKKTGKLPYHANAQLVFEEETFTEITEETETKTKYSSVERIDKADKYIYIYISTVQAIILPISAFESQEHINDFWAFIHTKTICKTS